MDVLASINKHSFGIFSTSEQHLNVHHIANCSASGHGKGEVDQAAGFLKTAAKRAVIANKDMAIWNAKDLYEFAEKYLASCDIRSICTIVTKEIFLCWFIRCEMRTWWNAWPPFYCINRKWWQNKCERVIMLLPRVYPGKLLTMWKQISGWTFQSNFLQ